MKYLKGTIDVGLWYSKGSLCDLIIYSNSVRRKIDRKIQGEHVTYYVMYNLLVF